MNLHSIPIKWAVLALTVATNTSKAESIPDLASLFKNLSGGNNSQQGGLAQTATKALDFVKGKISTPNDDIVKPPKVYTPAEATRKYLTHFGNTPEAPPIGGYESNSAIDKAAKEQAKKALEAKEEQAQALAEEAAEEKETPINPELAAKLKQVIANEQLETQKLNKSLTALMEMFSEREERLKAAKEAADKAAINNGLHLDIIFPSPKKQSHLPKSNKSKDKEPPIPKVNLSIDGPVPIMFYRAEPLEDLEDAIADVFEQQQADSAERSVQAQNTTPDEPTQGQSLNEALSNLNRLQAKKAALDIKERELQKESVA